MKKERLIRDIQEVLQKAGWTVTQRVISKAFPSYCRGRFNFGLYGVWQHHNEIGSVISALKKRGVIEEAGKKLVIPRRPSGSELEEVEARAMFSEPKGFRWPCCGTLDHEGGRGTHCPNCS